jgi:hypothetical protein
MIEIIKFLGGSTILIGAVAWVIKSLVAYVLSKNVETHKELMKAEIARGSRLQDERANVLREIYSNLVDLIENTHSFVHPAEMLGEPSRDEKQKLVAESLLKYKQYFERNKIFLSPDLCKRIEAFTNNFIEPAAQFAVFRRLSDSGGAAKDLTTAWLTAYDKMEKEVPAAREALEDEFREVIGINEIKKA